MVSTSSSLFVAGLVVAVAVAAGVAYGTRGAVAVSIAALAIAVVGGVGMGVLALARFETFLVVLLAVRPSLDALKGDSGGVLSPGVAAGGVFLLAAAHWLLSLARAGTLVPFSRTSRALAVLGVASLVSAVGSLDPVESLTSASKICSGLLMIAVVEQLARQRPDALPRLLAAALASLLVPTLLTIQEAGRKGAEARLSGGFVHPNALAEYVVTVGLVAAAIAIASTGARRQLAVVTFAVAVLLLLGTQARGAWIGFAVGVVLIAALVDRRLVIVAALGVVVLVTAVPEVTARFSDLSQQRQYGRGDPNSFAFRLRYWGEILPLANSSPITGIGIDRVRDESGEGLQPHSTPVQVYVESGVFGAGAFLAVVALLVADLRRALRLRSRLHGITRGTVVGASVVAAAFGLQMLTDNLLTQALQFWFLGVPIGWALGQLPARARSARVTV